MLMKTPIIAKLKIIEFLTRKASALVIINNQILDVFNHPKLWIIY